MYDFNGKVEVIKIEGMHIFNQTEIFELPWWYFWVVIGIGISIFAVGLTVMDKSKNQLIEIIGLSIGILAGTLMIIFGACWQLFEQPTGKYEYTVSIDDPNVNILDFNNKYEIMRQEGELWVIRDK